MNDIIEVDLNEYDTYFKESEYFCMTTIRNIIDFENYLMDDIRNLNANETLLTVIERYENFRY